MPLPTQITDYSTFDVPPYLIEFFKGTDLAAYAAANDAQYDELERACFDVINQLWLDLAQGAQLDVLGAHLNLPRNGMNDTTYRLSLVLQASINRAAGTPEAILDLATIIFADPTPIYLPAYPAGFIIQPSPAASGVGIGTDYDLADNSGDTIVDNLGNTIEIALFTQFTPAQLYDIAPAGVQMFQESNLLDNLGGQIVDNLGNLIMVLTQWTAEP